MDCKFHPEAEAVTTCAVCGAGMCSACDAGAFARLEKNEQPLCIECSFKEAEENVNSGERYLKIMKVKLIFATIFVVLSIFPLNIYLWNYFWRRGNVQYHIYYHIYNSVLVFGRSYFSYEKRKNENYVR